MANDKNMKSIFTAEDTESAELFFVIVAAGNDNNTKFLSAASASSAVK